MRRDRLDAELAIAREKSAKWQTRVRELERKIREQENLEIVQTVREFTTSPEELRNVLRLIRISQEPAAVQTAAEEQKESREEGAGHEE